MPCPHPLRLVIYTLLQKKRNFNFQIFYGDPGPGSVTPGHVHQGMSSDCARTVRNFGMGFLTNWYQEQCKNEIWPKIHWPTLLPKRKATSEKLRFFWGRVYITRLSHEMAESLAQTQNTLLIRMNHYFLGQNLQAGPDLLSRSLTRLSKSGPACKIWAINNGPF